MTAVGADAQVRRSARRGAVGLAGAAVNGICGFLLTVVIVRSFGAAGSGAIFTVIGLVTIAAAICCLGADTGLLWSLPKRTLGRAGDARRMLVPAFVPPLVTATVVAAVGAAVAVPLARVLLDGTGDAGDPASPADGAAGLAGNAGLVRLAFVAVPVIVAATLLLAAVRAVRPIVAYVAVQNVAVPLLRPLLMAGAVAVGGGVALGFAGWLLPVAAAAIVAVALVAGPLGPPARPQTADWRSFWGFALPRAGSVVIDASSMWVGVLLTSALAGPAEAGVFAAAGRYVLAGLLIMQGLRVAVAPQLSRLLAQDRLADPVTDADADPVAVANADPVAVTVYRRTTLFIVLLSWPGFLILGIFAPAFLELFGAGFAAAAPAMAVLCAAMLVNVGVGLVQTVLLMSGNSRSHLMATVFGLAVNLAACALLIPVLGALGAAIGWSCGVVVENVTAAFAARRVLGAPLFTAATARAAFGVAAGTGLGGAVAAAVAGRGLPGLALALAVLTAGCLALLADRRVRGHLAAARDLFRPPPPEAT